MKQTNNHIIQNPIKPSKGKLIKTFDKFGPDFEIVLDFTIETAPGIWKEIFVLSTGANSGEPGCRYPHLAVRDDAGERYFGLALYHDPSHTEHSEYGETLKLTEVQLNKPYQMKITHQNKILTWTVNGNVIGTITNSNPQMFSNMKLFATNKMPAFPGTISYFSLSAESKFYCK